MTLAFASLRIPGFPSKEVREFRGYLYPRRNTLSVDMFQKSLEHAQKKQERET
jgi:hypothetical protein